MNVRINVIAWVLVAVAAGPPARGGGEPNDVEFGPEILSLLKARCVKCHGPGKREGELNLSIAAGLVRGGENGPAVVPGSLEKSLLWKRVAADEMPEDAPLSGEEKEILKRWIAAGAVGLPKPADRSVAEVHWAFRQLTLTEPPLPSEGSQTKTPVDCFVLSRLEEEGLTLSPPADRPTLIRRVSFGLTGLPPTPDEIAQYTDDRRPDACERMIDRYLASPSYGERWGRHWLDTAGYADSNGYFQADTDRPYAYRYRDYVIGALNADRPFDRFIREQLAGDELAGYRPGGEITPEMIELLEATHYLRNSQDGTDVSDGNPDEVRADKYAVLEGTIQIMGSSLFGLTLQCARCHEHKFEPIEQHEYYQLQAILYPAFNIENWIKPKDRFVHAASRAQLAAWKEAANEIDDQIVEERQRFSRWVIENQSGVVHFRDGFDEAETKLAAGWSNVAPGDHDPAGRPAVRLDSAKAPAAQRRDGALHIIESGDSGDRAISTKRVFDWTPDVAGHWIQVTFDLVAGGATAPYVGYFIALGQFNDKQPARGGNVLLDGSRAGKAAVHVDYPGADSSGRGSIGTSGYKPGLNYGVRVTNVGDDRYELHQLVGGVPEEGSVELTAQDLPDGGFGFEYCCGRSFVVDNVCILASDPDVDPSVADEAGKALARRREEMEKAIEQLQTQRAALEPSRLAPVTDRSGEPPEVHLLVRSDYKTWGERVSPAAPAVLSDSDNPARLSRPENVSTETTGMRLAFARWLTRRDSRAASLLARVTVNRIWQRHFGTGIAETVDNLGYSGQPPSHPQLLEYLAAQLVRENWSLKRIHRLILQSTVYRQASTPVSAIEEIDPDNRLLWRYPLLRLDAEAVRDAMLFASGEMNLKAGGPYVPVKRVDAGDVLVEEITPGALRRSVYLQNRRTNVVSMLEVFDAPSIVFNCTRRNSTTVPLQSLNLLNSDFVRRRAAAMARRLVQADADVVARVERAFRLAFGRPPHADEMAVARDFLDQQLNEYSNKPDAEYKTWVDFCQMLLASNAFLYVE